MILHANLIFEGLDRVGKSTVVQHLTEYQQYKMTPPTSLSNTFYKYLVYFNKLNNMNKQTVPYVFDRGHTSELVYGKLYRPQYYRDGVLDYFIRKREAEIALNLGYTMYPTYIVYVEPRNTSIMLKDERPNANIEEELKMYEFELLHTTLPVIRISTQTETTWKAIEIILSELKGKLDDC